MNVNVSEHALRDTLVDWVDQPESDSFRVLQKSRKEKEYIIGFYKFGGDSSLIPLSLWRAVAISQGTILEEE